MNYFWFGDNLKDAVSKPRLHSQLFPNMVLVEPNFPKKYIKALKRYGHKRITNDTTLFTGESSLVCIFKLLLFIFLVHGITVIEMLTVQLRPHLPYAGEI